MMIHVTHLHVVPTPNVQTAFAHVCLNIKAILTLCVVLNVSSTMIALETKHVSITNAKIHVLVLVVKMLSVM